jgi:hypothetical protein
MFYGRKETRLEAESYIFLRPIYSTCATYYTQMKGFADKMAVDEKRLDNEEVICYILAGLDVDFNPFVEAFTDKTEPQTLDLYSQLLIFGT